MKTANFVTEVTVIDPETGGNVQIAIYKHENGGMFGIDSSYILQNFDEDEEIEVPDVFAHSFSRVMLIE